MIKLNHVKNNIMKKQLWLLTIVIFALQGCTLSVDLNKESNENNHNLATEVQEGKEVVGKSFEEWAKLINKISSQYNDIASIKSTLICLPDKGFLCTSNLNECEKVDPQVYIMIASFIPETGNTLSNQREVYRCDEKGCDRRRYDIETGGLYEIFSYIEGATFVKYNILDNSYYEVASLADQIWIYFGQCYYREAFE